ncbi:hypothetical protein [Flavobacterium fontis]|nr:hypothetical protein [Flavobacterium fontis]
MKTKEKNALSSKGTRPTMVQRAENDKGYSYKLKNGEFLYFPDKKFPVDDIGKNGQTKLIL